MHVETLPHETLNQLMPMHIVVSQTGHIRHVGPTAGKLLGAGAMTDQRLLEIFELKRPGGIDTIEKLRGLCGQRLHLRLRNQVETGLQGIVMPAGEADLILNLSFGIGVLDAVNDFNLTGLDFAVTDQAIEMLFLVEAKSAVTAELRQLNSRLQGARETAEVQAQTDELTGLSNRRALDMQLAQYVSRDHRFSLMHIDLDYFKEVNDTHGHAAGDHVLREVARLLREQTRAGDTVARAGGDEFVVLFPDLTDVALLKDIAMRIIGRLEEPIVFGDVICRISGSIGTTVSELYDHLDAERMLADADEALYASKHAGRAQVTFYGGAGYGKAETAAQIAKPG